MSIKAIVTLVIFFIFIFPPVLNFLFNVSETTKNPSQENINKDIEAASEIAIPWWISIYNFLSKWGILGAFLILLFTAFLFWIGEFKK